MEPKQIGSESDGPINQRLSKVLAAAGVASRRACEELIFAGCVRVNGVVIREPQHRVTLSDALKVNGKRIGSSQKKLYFIVHKPVGYLCSSRRFKNEKILLDLFGGINERLFTVGRLDRETSGLILVTNDGHFANKVIHPSAGIIKEYLAKTTQEITHEHLQEISAGLQVEGVFVKPVKVTKVRKGTLKICVLEGKKREVRHMLESAGLHILELQRIRIGGLHLGSLEPGQYRPLSEREQAMLFE